MTPARPVLFDMDGTLTDSLAIITACFDRTMREEAGVVHEPAFYRRFIGPPLHDSFAELGVADPARFVANALSPARVSRVVVHSVDNKTATAVVPDFQLSLAIGKEGQNARLAARLTEYHIDIHADTETGDEPLASRSSMPDDVTSRSYSDPLD